MLDTTKVPEAVAKYLEPPASVDPVLVNILSWKRPHESVSEIEFCSWLFAEIKNRGGHPIRMGMGNIVVDVPTADGKTATTLFSCHVDTMHSEALGRQQIVYDPSFGHIFLDKSAPNAGSCLGADDGAGVWLMLEMIAANKPGVYVFHRGEERGGLGSRDMLAKHKDFLKQFSSAVAFDRPDNNEIILTQGRQRCASDKFGTTLAARLKQQEMVYELSHKGMFTDTKVYRGVIPECINLGVGYRDQHGCHETLDYDHLVKLRTAVLAVDWETLPVDRDPTAPEPHEMYSWRGRGQSPQFGFTSSHGQRSLLDDDDDFDPNGKTYPVPLRGQNQYGGKGSTYPFPERAAPAPPPKTPAPPPAQPEDPYEDFALTVDELLEASMDGLRDTCEALGDDVVYTVLDLLEEITSLRSKVELYKGLVRLQ